MNAHRVKLCPIKAGRLAERGKQAIPDVDGDVLDRGYDAIEWADLRFSKR